MKYCMKRFISFFRKWLLPFLPSMFSIAICFLLHLIFPGMLTILVELPSEQLFFIMLSGYSCVSFGSALHDPFVCLDNRRRMCDQEDRA